MYKKIKESLAFVFCVAFTFFFANFLVYNFASAATLSTGPSAGTFTVGSTFDVSIYLNTEGKIINAVEASISFPPDKLQLVSPSAGKSVIGVWTVQPSVNNQIGRIDFQGGIPGGINVSSGLVTTLTFRVKSVGTAVIKFLDNSKTLLHDGKGTNDLNETTNGVYGLVLPPPAGPIVSSETHPDQSLWYKSPNAVLSWAADENVEGYSFEVSQDPSVLPDDIIDSEKNIITYRNLGDGVKYFHIKALRKGVWGGTTHFALKIDTTPPADFKTVFIPSGRTVRRQPIIQFDTTDADSGIDHYELKLVALFVKEGQKENGQPLFIEATSPYIPESLEIGNYDVIIRAYDQAGNFREKISRLNIVISAFEFISGEGVQVSVRVIIPWKWFLPPVLLFVMVLAYIAYRVSKWRKTLLVKATEKKLPDHIKQQLEELSRYRQKYGKALILFLVFFSCFMFTGLKVSMASNQALLPPFITTLSDNISNQDIFYIGGKTDSPNVEVILHLQNLTSGETLNNKVVSDKRGEWFYRHDVFLPTGSYIIWAQTQIGEELSPPSPQKSIYVKQTALQFGSSRLSYEFIYLTLLLLMLLVMVLLIVYIFRHRQHAKKHHKLLLDEIRKAEESVIRGFAVIKRDLESEIAVIRKAKLKGQLSLEEAEKEKNLIKDIAEIEEKIGKEIWDIERIEQN